MILGLDHPESAVVILAELLLNKGRLSVTDNLNSSIPSANSLSKKILNIVGRSDPTEGVYLLQ